jgi:hypothetical protein
MEQVAKDKGRALQWAEKMISGVKQQTESSQQCDFKEAT